ncbi:telomere repeats-binding bouquet formation protein 1 [Salarias fasciatus]|uniref:telomere repeats-binding bouquet formation protein 1 n=1 Tax=Salarias fasciatus TaxID=181472 RepID=UPI0011767078|nr:telomere repeats-binding bouquet formation protein 1 [Salarias fasciatus]
MEKTVVSRNTTETDLSLLLKCLKCQMKRPDLQKQALYTIRSICENKEENMDLLREMGGVAFLYNLSKSSIVHPGVQETALGTLGALAEANVYCKNYLCKKETFADLADCLRKQDVRLTHKRVSVFLLFVLVANNKAGQTLAQTTGCLAVLLDLFRTTFPLSAGAASHAANAAEVHQLWQSASCALCGCINNPQNEDGQRVCVAVFPEIKIWLQQIDLPHTEIFQPLCSFIAMAVSNNSCVQESFSACGGLETLTRALTRVASAAQSSLLSCQLSAMISKTLSACITDNCILASCVAQYGVVSQLLSLLESPHLDPEDRLSVLLSLGSCTAVSEEHQLQLLQCGGLPVIITLLTDDTNEEIKRAATFILQTCKQATMCLGERHRPAGGAENADSPTHLEDFWNSAAELLHKIDRLKRNGTSAEGQSHLAVKKINPGKSQTNLEDVSCSASRGAGARVSSHVRSLESGSEPQTENSHFYECPQPENCKNSREIKRTAELQDSETVEEVLVEGNSVSHIRCAGCVLPFEEVTSRNFASILSSCCHRCDMHKVLQEATERFRVQHCKLLFRNERQYDNLDGRGPDKRPSATGLQRDCEKWSTVTLTPLRRRAKEETSVPYNRAGPSLTPMKRQHLPADRSAVTDRERRRSGKPKLDNQQTTDSDYCDTRRRRRNFTCEEVHYLLSGARRYGGSWTSCGHTHFSPDAPTSIWP